MLEVNILRNVLDNSFIENKVYEPQAEWVKGEVKANLYLVNFAQEFHFLTEKNRKKNIPILRLVCHRLPSNYYQCHIFCATSNSRSFGAVLCCDFVFGECKNVLQVLCSALSWTDRLSWKTKILTFLQTFHHFKREDNRAPLKDPSAETPSFWSSYIIFILFFSEWFLEETKRQEEGQASKTPPTSSPIQQVIDSD